MFRPFGALLVCVVTSIFAGNSIGSSSVEDTVQKRIGMFKSSGTNIKKLGKFYEIESKISALGLQNTVNLEARTILKFNVIF